VIFRHCAGMPARPHKPAELVGTVFHAAYAIENRLLTRAELRGSGWRRLLRGVYADADRPVDHRLRCQAAAMVLPPRAAMAGRSAAWLYGARVAADHDPVEVVTPPEQRIGRRVGLRVHTAPLPDEEVRVNGSRLRLTAPARTCWDLAQWSDVIEAVTALDWLVREGVVDVDSLRAYGAARAGGRGTRRFDRVVSLVDPAAESPAESRLRARLVAAGLPSPVARHQVEQDGVPLARADLAWPEHRLALGYDAAPPGPDDRPYRDHVRLTAAGWLVLHVTDVRLAGDFDGVVAELRENLRLRQPD